jgi:hypothetical protein
MNTYLIEYGKKNDEELLRLACDRASLIDEAAAALDLELSRRNLTEADRHRYDRDRRRQRSLESKRVLRRTLGTRRGREQWFNDLVLALVALFVTSLIAAGYQSLPGEYRLKATWQTAATDMLFTSVSVVVFGFSLWRRLGFWLSLTVSSALHVGLVHAWVVSGGYVDAPGPNSSGKLAILLGLLLFAVIYVGGTLVARKLRGERQV